MTRRLSNGLCSRCWQRHPERASNHARNLTLELEEPPAWLLEFADFAADRHCMARACVMITAVGRLLRDGQPANPQALLERSRLGGRSAGALARTLEEFFVGRGLAFGLDEPARLAAGRRRRRVVAVPEPLRPAVAGFCEHLVRSRERARRTGTLERADSTIEGTLSAVRDLACFLAAERTKTDWASVQVDDIESFLNTQPRNRQRRLGSVRQFFTWAQKNRIVLVEPTSTITGKQRTTFAGATLTLGEQRRLFCRWSNGPDVHPHEALVGLLALLHALTNLELRSIRVDGLDVRTKTLLVPGRPYPVPLDPVSLAAIEVCLADRSRLGSHNPHLIVTRTTKTRSTPASPAYVAHALDPAGVAPKKLRATRLVDLVISIGPKVVAASLGMDPDGLLAYVTDDVDDARLSS